MSSRSIASAFVLAALMGALPSAAAAPSPTDAQHHRGGARRGPPPEALEACAELEEGDACQVTFHEHTLEGTCRNTHEDELACMPDQPPPPPDGEAPPAGDGAD